MEEEDPNELPLEFVPSDSDVICGWARQNYHHAGNRMLRDLIQECVPKYMKASTKTEKGHVIIDIVDRIRKDSPTGVGLVRQNKNTGRWFYIGLEKAKDKIGHALRKASLEKSRSQSKEKKTPRKHQYPSTDSLTTAASSTSPSPTPISSVSLPSSPAHNHQEKYEERAPVPYYPHYDEAYHRAYQHYHYSAYHHHYPHPPAHELASRETSAHHPGYDVYYQYASAHSYAPADYSYSAEGAHQPLNQHLHAHHASTPLGHSQLAGSGDSILYNSPVIHSPVASEH
ncbi:unnamed protein product [Cylindrotheca closterium]|uniref:DUF6824 domain-containing protein n=1 Tax=Cylindrotheca closterium TaxID=2856 RepID=A0AAD2FZ75_9STRA|nr:unnamed protein product [Cylindrotheca closterium]